LRHGFGIYALHSGVPINLVQRWLGHASMTTTAIYLQAIGAEEREIAARMWHQDGGESLHVR
jgi:site-specific recombinase XerD